MVPVTIRKSKCVRNMLALLFILTLVCGTVSCGKEADEPGEPDATTPSRIAVIPKATAHSFWKTVQAGAVKAGRELGVEVLWIGPQREDDRTQQIQVVQNFIAGQADAIVLAPLDEVALTAPVELAVSRGIPVVIIDSALKSEAQSSFVATDNTEGGRLAARRLAEVMGGKGKAIMLRYNPGHASTGNREEGFLEEMNAKFPDIELVSTNQYGGVSELSAATAGQGLLNKYGDDIQGIFCPNESSSFGMLRALENTGRAGKINFVGFDASQGLIDGMRAGNIQGLVAQDPFDMGYKGVKTAVAILNGETVEKQIATRLTLVTPENLDADEVRQVIEPELSRWLE
jgi:ribose transport system substrate-binding protein